MQTTIGNEFLQVKINSFGAELSSIVNKKNGKEYLWNADEKFWKRSSPVLFPFVGSLKDKEYIYDGVHYPMGQHGFARDMEFKVVGATPESCRFVLNSDSTTIMKYPFKFALVVAYSLEGKTLKVAWNVINEDNKEMYFQIGAHPAFMCPINNEGKQTDYYIKFDLDRDLVYNKLNSNGLIESKGHKLLTDGGILKIDEHLFDEDALVIEGNQAHEVSLCDNNKRPYLTVKFDAPLFGLWSPAKKNAPFVCIEPWYGRCDDEEFNGTLSEREYEHTLAAGDTWSADYDITIK